MVRKHPYARRRGGFKVYSAALLFFTFAIARALQVVAPPWAGPAVVSLAWDADPGADGYLVRWGLASGNYSFAEGCGTNRQLSISNLAGGLTWYFTVEAYQNIPGWNIRAGRAVTNYVTYSPAPEISTNLPAIEDEPQLVITNGVCLVSAFSSSSDATLQSSSDLRQWLDVATTPVLYVTPATNNQFFRMKLSP